MKECVIVPTYKREELLYCCLVRIRKETSTTPVIVFSDRGERSDALADTCWKFNTRLVYQPTHDYYGNSFSAAEALRWAYQHDYDYIHYIENDAMVKPGWWYWTTEVHREWNDIFCSCGWVFNREMPLEPETYFAPWIYIPQFTIRRDKLELLLPHFNPIYYRDLQKYIWEQFENNPLDNMHPHAVHHYEIDGLMQRVLLQHKMQVAWNGIAQVEHVGFAGYNKGGDSAYEEFFQGEKDFKKRVQLVEEFIADPQWRVALFGREIVERELGREIPEQKTRYKMIKPGGWESEFTSSVPPSRMGRRINSAPVDSETKFVVIS